MKLVAEVAIFDKTKRIICSEYMEQANSVSQRLYRGT